MSSMASSSASRSRASAHSRSFSSSVLTHETLLLSSEVKVDENGWVHSPRRVGGPTLCSLPVLVDRVSDQYNERTGFYSNELHILTEAKAILRTHGITSEQVLALGRRSFTDREPEPIPTVLVMMDHQSVNNNWLIAAKEIHRKLVGEFRGISVEIIDERLNTRMHCYPVERSHSVFEKWERIANAIMYDDLMNRAEWNGISIWRYGSNSDSSENRVTLIVNVQESAVGPFETSRQRIHDVLAAEREENNVDILFLEASFELYAQTPGVPADACTKALKPGVSIGIVNSSAGSSTLGGIVKLRFSNRTPWTPYALTCFHCVFAPEGHRANLLKIPDTERECIAEKDVILTIAFQKVLQNPVQPGDDPAQNFLRVEQPSTVDLNQSIKSTDGEISEIKSEKFMDWKVQADKIALDPSDGFLDEREKGRYNKSQVQIAKLENRKAKFRRYRDKNDLGRLFAGSGFGRIKDSPNRRGISSDQKKSYMDWALIKVNEWRFDREDGKLQGNKPFGYLGTKTDDFMQTGKFDAVYNEKVNVRKSGRSTWITAGKCNELLTYTFKHEQSPGVLGGPRETVTHEWTIKSTNNQPFAEHGDSGAFVYGAQGQVVGILFGGIPTLDVAFMSDIRDVFKDIKEVTGAEDVRIADWTGR
ncbi:uncharacterized protein N7498_008810 [Penicillium cinerascens]|uniref:Uncharacterized protein n=1 Tax=Penicillium cinerascens TaxID=70096 RepID=A0A9W9JG65_9EURO|nr:uncharacterized protein N7498_008810 [Penicillium cinerascens]KAJ5195372.1 hypothetical protein N7498_008810 [Penicillium cinerascens]